MELTDKIACCSCSKDIPVSKIVLKAMTDELDPEYKDILCSSCIRKEYGKELYDFVKNTLVGK